MRTPDNPRKVNTGNVRTPGTINLAALPEDIQGDIWTMAYDSLQEGETIDTAVYYAARWMELILLTRMAEAMQKVYQKE